MRVVLVLMTNAHCSSTYTYLLEHFIQVAYQYFVITHAKRYFYMVIFNWSCPSTNTYVVCACHSI